MQLKYRCVVVYQIIWRILALKVTYCMGLSNNIFWILQPDECEPEVYCFDPGDFSTVNGFLVENGYNLKAIFLTHRHIDHWGGAQELRHYWGCEIFGPQHESMHVVSKVVRGGGEVEIGAYIFRCLRTPGHTDEHIAYFYPGDEAEAPILFSGDIIFRAGCGRSFDGHPGVLWKTIKSLKRLPRDTRVFYAHDYAKDNLEFASEIDPSDLNVLKMLELVHKESTMKPTSIGEEMLINPFLKCDDPDFVEKISCYFNVPIRNSIQCFTLIRSHKNSWR